MMGSPAVHVALVREPALREHVIAEPFYAISTLAWAKGYTLPRPIRHPFRRMSRLR